MDTTLALLADYANVTGDGKLNIMGVFDVITAPSFPYFHPQMNLIFRLEAHAVEAGSSKKVEVRLMTSDGSSVFSLAADMKLPEGDPGQPITINQVLGFQNVRFEREGDYQIVVLINGDVKATVPLRVRTEPEQVN